MGKKKKLTRKEKIKLTKQGICWKCGSKELKKDKKKIECQKCNLEVVIV